jgi:HK97 gp10 family phage protein
MAVTMVITGDERLNAQLAKLKGPEAKKIIRQAARKALKPVQDTARRNAPKRTGSLRKSIVIRSLAKSRKQIGARVLTGRDTVKTKHFYSAFQEFGWKAGRRATNEMLGIAGRKRRTQSQKELAQKMNSSRKQVPGKHYIEQAANATRFTALEIYRFEIAEGIKKLASE